MAKSKLIEVKSLVLVFLGIFTFSTFYMVMWPMEQSQCDCTKASQKEEVTKHPRNIQLTTKFNEMDNSEWGPHKLAVIVPFRDRFEELMEFVPYMHNYLNNQRIHHKIYVINQVDILRFNRASLVNIGYLESQSECDYMAMHDVDLLPANTNLSYAYPEQGPYHLAAPDLHPKYHYKTFVGGILLLTKEHYKLVNGMSNKYWGWGREDDEFYVRIKDAQLEIFRPQGLKTGINDTFRHMHERRKRPRDNRRYFDQKAKSRIRDRITGLDTVQYDVISRSNMLIEGAPVTVINIELYCDLDFTRYCISEETYDVIQAYLEAQQKGEIGKSPDPVNNSPGTRSKYVFTEPLDLHNFIFKDKHR